MLVVAEEIFPDSRHSCTEFHRSLSRAKRKASSLFLSLNLPAAQLQGIGAKAMPCRTAGDGLRTGGLKERASWARVRLER